MQNSHTSGLTAGAIACAISLLSGPALAVEQGDWLVRAGWAHVSPNDDSSGFSLAPTVGAAVDEGNSLGLTLTYMLTDNWGLGVLAALPFKHDINATGAVTGKVAEVEHLPPTVTLQYHINPGAAVRPYVGAGINYTTFFSEETTGPLAGTGISLEDSWGLAAEVGVDIDISADGWFVNGALWYLDIDTEAKTALGTADVEIDPWVFMLGVGTSF